MHFRLSEFALSQSCTAGIGATASRPRGKGAAALRLGPASQTPVALFLCLSPALGRNAGQAVVKLLEQ